MPGISMSDGMSMSDTPAASVMRRGLRRSLGTFAVTVRAGRALSPQFVPNCRGDTLGGGHAYAHRTIEYDIKHWISRKRSF